jgi:soluble lytic murein transglycosylase-like protein
MVRLAQIIGWGAAVTGVLYVLSIKQAGAMSQDSGSGSKSESSDLENKSGVETLTPMQIIVYRAAVDTAIDPAMALAIIEKESRFDPLAINKSDPSYGLGQVQTFWVPYFDMGSLAEARQLLLGPEFNARITALIIRYFFYDRTFAWPEEADIYNVGETKWRAGIRSESYKRAVSTNYLRWKGVLA